MKRKYKLLPKQLVTFETSVGPPLERKMYRLKALRDIPAHSVKAGDLGGWVSGRDSLSHEGDCWIGGEAVVYIDYWNGILHIGGAALITGKAVVCALGKARVVIGGNAVIEDNAIVFVGDGASSVKIHRGARLYGNALIENPIEITGQIGGSAAVSSSSVLGRSHVSGNAKVRRSTVLDTARVMEDAVVNSGSRISDDAVITGEANVSAAAIRGNATVSGQARVQDLSIISDSVTVTGHAVIRKEVNISGESVVKDNALISEGARISGKSVISGDTVIDAYRNYADFISADSRSLSATASMKELAGTIIPISGIERTQLKLAGLEQEISAYGNDIVKLLKFPIMNDMRDENTLEMMLALKNSKTIDPDSEPDEFCEAVNLLERKFMKAESNALIISATAFSDDQRKKADKARDLFAIACNEVSSEQEKKNAFKQGFRQLEGVVAITPLAVENMRAKVGIPELEA